MKPALALLAISLMCACTPAPDRAAPAAEASAFLGRLGTLLPDTGGGTGCALAVRRGNDLVLVQEKPGGSALVQGPDGRQRVPLQSSDGQGPGGFAMQQFFADDRLQVRLALNDGAMQGEPVSGILSVSAVGGMTAILPVNASISCTP